MFLRREVWKTVGIHNSFLNLGADASLQGGRDWRTVNGITAHAMYM
jgi:hypothetical protein